MNSRPRLDLKAAMEAAELDEVDAETIGHAAVAAIVLTEQGPSEQDFARLAAEQERRDREDDAAAYSMEILDKWRRRVNRTKWTRSDGIAQHKIIEALRALPGDE